MLFRLGSYPAKLPHPPKVNARAELTLAALFIAVCALLLLRAIPSFAAAPFVIGNDPSYHLGGAAVEVLEDPGRNLTIDDVTSPRYAARFTPSRQYIPNFGMTDSAFWLRLTLQRDSLDNGQWLLLLEQPLMDEADLYIPRNNIGFDVLHAGDTRPITVRPILQKDILFPLSLTKEPKTFYLRTWVPGRAIMPLTLLTTGALRKMELCRQFVFGGYTGLMLCISLVCLFMFLMFRDRTFLYFMALVLGLYLSQLIMYGYLYLLIPARLLYLHEILIHLVWDVVILCGFLFVGSFLKTAIHAPRMDRALRICVWLCIAMIPLPFFRVPPLLFKQILNIFMLFSLMITIFASIVAWRAGFKPARYFLLGRLTLYGAAALFFLTNEGLISINVATTPLFLYGSLLEVLFISIAFSERFRILKQERDVSVASLYHEVEERTSANRALEEEMVRRLRLEREIVKVSDNERRCISHQLHDGLCQQLAGIRIHFAALEDQLTDTGLALRLHSIEGLLDNAVDHAYHLSRGLWSADIGGGGTFPDLHNLAEELSALGGIPIEIKQHNGCVSCSGESLIQMYHIAREAVANALKHSGATLVSVLLTCDPETGIHLEVRDDGSGMGLEEQETTGRSMGISIMKHRAVVIGGDMMIAEAAEGGTMVVCHAPCCDRLAEEPDNV